LVPNIRIFYLRIVGQPVKVWVVGSSITKHAFVHARSRPGGVNLGLSRLNVSIWWQGKSGMVIKDLPKVIPNCLRFEDPPQFLVIHVGVMI